MKGGKNESGGSLGLNAFLVCECCADGCAELAVFGDDELDLEEFLQAWEDFLALWKSGEIADEYEVADG